MRGRKKYAGEKYSPEDLDINIHKAIYGVFNGEMPFPLVLQIVKNTRRDEAIVALMRYIEGKSIARRDWRDFNRIYLMFLAAEEYVKNREGVSDPIHFSMLQANGLLQAMAEHLGRPKVEKVHLLRYWQKSFGRERLEIEESEAYRIMRRLGLPQKGSGELHDRILEETAELAENFKKIAGVLKQQAKRIRRLKVAGLFDRLHAQCPGLSEKQLEKLAAADGFEDEIVWQFIIN